MAGLVAHGGLEVARIVEARPLGGGVGTLQERLADLPWVVPSSVVRFELAWVVR